MKNILDQLTNLDENQLTELNAAVVNHINFLRKAKARAMKASLNEGDKVQWVGKAGFKEGTVVAIKRKFAHVVAKDASGTWRVPMNMLTIV